MSKCMHCIPKLRSSMDEPSALSSFSFTCYYEHDVGQHEPGPVSSMRMLISRSWHLYPTGLNYVTAMVVAVQWYQTCGTYFCAVSAPKSIWTLKPEQNSFAFSKMLSDECLFTLFNQTTENQPVLPWKSGFCRQQQCVNFSPTDKSAGLARFVMKLSKSTNHRGYARINKLTMNHQNT